MGAVTCDMAQCPGKLKPDFCGSYFLTFAFHIREDRARLGIGCIRTASRVVVFFDICDRTL